MGHARRCLGLYAPTDRRIPEAGARAAVTEKADSLALQTLAARGDPQEVKRQHKLLLQS